MDEVKCSKFEVLSVNTLTDGYLSDKSLGDMQREKERERDGT